MTELTAVVLLFLFLLLVFFLISLHLNKRFEKKKEKKVVRNFKVINGGKIKLFIK